MMTQPIHSPRPLEKGDDLSAFDCGVPRLNDYLRKEAARAFYTNFGFEPSPVNDLHLYLLMKDIQKTLKGRTRSQGCAVNF
jgi:hypothetical protein